VDSRDRPLARERRLVFGEVAEAYDRARPSYPSSVVDEVLAFAGLAPGAQGGAFASLTPDAPGSRDQRVLEVGAGTGKATVLFAERGFEMLCLEPHPALAAVLARNCAPFPGVRIDGRSLEEWPPEPSAFRLLIAAQAWHWVTPGIGYRKAHAALAPSGTLALFWNRHGWEKSDLGRALDDVYARLAPDVAKEEAPLGPDPYPAADDLTTEIEASGFFGPARVSVHPWSQEYETERYLELIQTYSAHRMLDEDRRRCLVEAVGAAIRSAGGRVTIRYRTRLYLASRQDKMSSPEDKDSQC
jgi:SAM-dependent methyltransferase